MTVLKTLGMAIFGAGIAVSSVSANSPTVQQQFVTIGTGGVTGVYYPTGGAICRLVNRSRKDTGIRCSVESTGGSAYNLNTIRAGDMDMGIVQSDWQFHATNGTSKFEANGPDKELRAVFSLHPEAFTVLARKDANIKTFEDLKGKRVNIGNPGSGQRGTMEQLMAASGWTTKVFSLTSELKSSEQAKALCDNKIDAFVFTAGHPSGSLKEATTSCDTNLVTVTGPAVDKLISENPYYRTATIPGGMYRGNDADVQTFGVAATFVASTRLSDETVYQVTKSVFEDLSTFKQMHQAFGTLKKEEMITDGLSAPLHKGAERYFMEAGLIKK
ncbi:C4-dicarboxylate ABC transporter substrate-binding protein [Endozoicomonas montiporae]|uniref:C4-dicarboxylate ABC transporter substrate-binding protein n=2 Tax=Endozoicomonas montiporae TaxID=1027273 RepID=A0A081NAC0_9GAMM|nr:TAXI family TRAP transporter solute-binding subunit [Endozoicomonas montiporae]AMO56928.1 putative TRAP transporter solute receptor, TAXI family precursor [Endozoicomonas montiporae CL-33]KEQ15393.1 C4-dicarboxylate ABC transporter substrate-binding protein [Endozoicomonas montiporae]